MQDDNNYNTVEPSARNPRESADLTIDMLTGKAGLMARRQPSDEAKPSSNMPRNNNHHYLLNPPSAPTINGAGAGAIPPLDDGFSIE